MSDQMSVEERLEKLEKSKSRDVLRQERAEQLEKLKKSPIKYVPDDPSRIKKSYAQIIADKRAKKEEEVEVKKFLAERKNPKEAKDGVQKEAEKEKIAPPVEVKAKKGRPKKIE